MKSKFRYAYYQDNLRSNPNYIPYEPTPNKFKYYYVKVNKDDDIFYLDRKGNLVKKSEATPFTYDSAHKTVITMKSNPDYNSYAITSFGTDHALSGFITLCEQVPPIFVRNNKVPANYAMKNVFGETDKIKSAEPEHDLKDAPSGRDQTVKPILTEPDSVKPYTSETNQDNSTSNQKIDSVLPSRRAEEPRENNSGEWDHHSSNRSNIIELFIVILFTLICCATLLTLAIT